MNHATANTAIAALSTWTILLDTKACFLAVATPGVFGPDYFRALSEVLAASAGGPPDPAAIAAVMRRHGLTPARDPGIE